MFKKQNNWILYGFILVFIVLILQAIRLQSELYLYAASGIPMLIFYVLPDIKRDQYIHGAKDREWVKLLVQQNGGEEQLLVLSFQPDFIRWDRSRLYFHLNDIPETPASTKSNAGSSLEASIPVLAFDLVPHRRKQGWIGINLTQLAERTKSLSYTTDEVTRFVIRMKDLEEAAVQMFSTATSASNKSKGKSISA